MAAQWRGVMFCSSRSVALALPDSMSDRIVSTSPRCAATKMFTCANSRVSNRRWRVHTGAPQSLHAHLAPPPSATPAGTSSSFRSPMSRSPPTQRVRLLSLRSRPSSGVVVVRVRGSPLRAVNVVVVRYFRQP
ncbi:hypothetical protein OH76DRAFT_191120 [Lentinus brumalis]|uniref:Uncharacterized protein n=1 Tax=Lentinus brumalis TaxID=2498619 RepID=A0A371CMT2_9APHY|nr:hypothetical protein OH76DRAFT_191120 [Polyporus brumalis]